ncbi:MAG: 50S ribosomal protein L30 [Desulfobacterales bacterium]|nr:50S ribosomal protein L30 [Desulfobacterales bacterium]MBF0396462.1 50S ribosomal protein L30 [Desulfobacterales bacterium]
MLKSLKITLIKSMIGTPEKHRKVLRALGLRKLNKSISVEDTPILRGMVNKVIYLLKVEEVKDAT